MGAGQFLRDFRRDYHLKKSLAHRKAVTQRKEKAEEKRMKVHMQQIEQDRSPSKKYSHVRLLSLVNELGYRGLVRLYAKNELKCLCDAYDVVYRSSWNKDKLAGDLANAILSVESMPNHQMTSRYTINSYFDIGKEYQRDRVPIIRIRRV